jgi:hypothetical protein
MNLTIHQARDLTVKAFGLYCLVKLIVFLPNAFAWAGFPAHRGEDAYSRSMIIAAASLPLFFYALFAFLFLFKTGWVRGFLWKGKEEEVVSSRLSPSDLSFWVVLMGLSLLIFSLTRLSDVFIRFLVNQKDNFWASYLWVDYIPDFLLFLFAVILLAFPVQVARCLLRAERPESSEGPALDS